MQPRHLAPPRSPAIWPHNSYLLSNSSRLSIINQTDCELTTFTFVKAVPSVAAVSESSGTAFTGSGFSSFIPEDVVAMSTTVSSDKKNNDTVFS